MGLIIVIASSRLIDLLICVYLCKSVVQLKPGSSFRRSIDRLYIDCDIDAVCPIVSVGAISGRKYAPLHDSAIKRFHVSPIRVYLRKSVVDDCIDWDIFVVCSTSSVGPISGRNDASLHVSTNQQYNKRLRMNLFIKKAIAYFDKYYGF